MRPLVLAASLLLLASVGALAGDCDACMPEKMCNRHQKEHDETLKLATSSKGLKSRDAMVRKEALDKIGKLNDDHLNSRSKESAAAIANMLDDPDSGIRMGAVTYLATNQDIKTARMELGKVLDKFIPKVSKPKPSGKTAASGVAGVEWENALSLVKECISAMEKLGGEGVDEYFITALKSPNMSLASHAIARSVGIKSRRLVEAYLERLDKLASEKSDEEKTVCEELARAFATQTLFSEQLGENRASWLKKAREWWQERKEAYDPPPEPPKEGEDGK